MQKRKLRDLEVSTIGVGCMGFSHGYGKVPETEYSINAMRKAFDAGCNFFDTAEVYGDVVFYPGHNEELVGKALGSVRNNVVLATKLHLRPDEVAASPSVYDAVKAHLVASMKRLGTDYVDLYYLHRINEDVSFEEVAAAMGRLIDEGLIRGWGLSQVDVDTLAKAHAVTPVSAVQNIYSMLERGCEAEVIPYCVEHNIGFVPFSPIASGFLSGKVTVDTKFEEVDDVRKFVPQLKKENITANQPILDVLADFSKRKNATNAQISLAWMLHKYPNVVPIPGSKNLERILENLGAADVTLTDILRFHSSYPSSLFTRTAQGAFRCGLPRLQACCNRISRRRGPVAQHFIGRRMRVAHQRHRVGRAGGNELCLRQILFKSAHEHQSRKLSNAPRDERAQALVVSGFGHQGIVCPRHRHKGRIKPVLGLKSSYLFEHVPGLQRVVTEENEAVILGHQPDLSHHPTLAFARHARRDNVYRGPQGRPVKLRVVDQGTSPALGKDAGLLHQKGIGLQIKTDRGRSRIHHGRIHPTVYLLPQLLYRLEVPELFQTGGLRFARQGFPRRGTIEPVGRKDCQLPVAHVRGRLLHFHAGLRRILPFNRSLFRRGLHLMLPFLPVKEKGP